MLTKTQFDPRFLMIAAVLLLATFFVPPIFSRAMIALAIATVVLSSLPLGTRGVVSAVMVGLATGIASINLFAIGIFQGPITHEFGWTQAEYSLVTPVGTLVTVVSSIIIGRLFDRTGVRRWAMLSATLFGLTLISLYWLTPSKLQFYGTFALVPLIGAGTSSVAYSRVVARWFDARRGQAFGAALAGIGIGGAVLAAVSQSLINEVGWRGAYVGLGLLSLCITLPVLYFNLRDTPQERGLGPDGLTPDRVAALGAPAVVPPAVLTGFSAAESRRNIRFWLMLGSFLLLAFAIGGVMIPLVPILKARGVSPNQAAAMVGGLGLALIVGRAFAGFLMDRLFAPHVAAVILLFPIIGVSMLALGATGIGATIAAVCVGLAAGAELDVIAVLITRYFGTRAYAENYGWQYAAWTLGSGSAPVVTNYMFDRTGSHTMILWVYVAFFVVAALLISRFGRYPDLPVATPQAGNPVARSAR